MIESPKIFDATITLTYKLKLICLVNQKIHNVSKDLTYITLVLTKKAKLKCVLAFNKIETEQKVYFL